jgi:predicted nucleic acid-binding protein
MNEKKESIFEVTFTNDSTVFIKAMDEEHARRIVERNSTQWLSAELTIEMIIKKIEKVED